MTYISTKRVSAVNTPENSKLEAMKMVPLGASVWTSTGDLADSGITAIAQAASGAMDRTLGVGFDPTRDSVAACVQNSFLLAAANGHDKLAIPFIASGIFYTYIKPTIEKDELAEIIVESCQENRGSVEAVIVAYGEKDMGHFKKAMNGNTDEGVTLVEGSITSFADHGCAAIANAANMEVRFGGGLSGKIGAKTNKIAEIDAEAAEAVAAFWKANSPGEGVGATG
ncbi:MAG: hypothetical protein OEM82_09255 [Acidobacteriota bacterium]|nr:hypothetical protein [Acidobacteriota bacterium]MDH3531222.1 hypothetical protein [Acidobacteriota bacterium]